MHPTNAHPSANICVADAGHLASRVRSGALWSFAFVALRYALNLIGTAILSRLLAPHEYGLFGMAATVTVLLSAFADAGLSWATIQRRQITRQQVDNLFWVNLAIGAVLWAVTVAISPAIALFYGEPAVAPTAAMLGGVFFFSSIGVQGKALLQRSLKNKEVTFAEIGGQAVGVSLGVVIAVVYSSAWALVAQQLGIAIFRSAFLLLKARYVPRAFRKGAGTQSLVVFGTFVVASNFVDYLAKNIDNIIIGYQFGAESLGFYGRAFFLASLPAAIAGAFFTRVAVPTLSAAQDNASEKLAAYKQGLTVSAFLGFFMGGLLFLTARESILFVYGRSWLPAVTLLELLSISALVQPIIGAASWALVAIGSPRRLFVLATSQAIVVSVVVVFASSKGPTSVAAAVSITSLLTAIPFLVISNREIGMANTQMLFVLLISALSASTALLSGEVGMRLVDAMFGVDVLSLVTQYAVTGVVAVFWLMRSLGPQGARRASGLK